MSQEVADADQNNVSEVGFSKFATWAKSTQILWCLSLTLNALFTTIGVGSRDLAGTECKLNATRTFGKVGNSFWVFWTALSIYIIVCSVVIVCDAVYTYCKYFSLCCFKKYTGNSPKEIFRNLLINICTSLSGSFYFAADNFYLVADRNGSVNGVKAATFRSFFAGTSILLTLVVFVIAEWFKESIPSKKVGHQCECKVDNCCNHEKDKECNEVCCQCTPDCCTETTVDNRTCNKHQRNHAQCYNTNNDNSPPSNDTPGDRNPSTGDGNPNTGDGNPSTGDGNPTPVRNNCLVVKNYSRVDPDSPCQCKGHCCRKHREEVPLYKFLLSWSPWALVIATFDSLFISIVQEVSGEEDVRNGVKCDLLTEQNGAMGFYVAITGLYFIGVVGFGLIQAYRVNKWWSVKPQFFSSSSGECIMTSCLVIKMSILYLFIGGIFFAVDNNWPWICYAKHAEMNGVGSICSWVRARVTLLALVFVALASLLVLVVCLIISEECHQTPCENICVRKRRNTEPDVELHLMA